MFIKKKRLFILPKPALSHVLLIGLFTSAVTQIWLTNYKWYFIGVKWWTRIAFKVWDDDYLKVVVSVLLFWLVSGTEIIQRVKYVKVRQNDDGREKQSWYSVWCGSVFPVGTFEILWLSWTVSDVRWAPVMTSLSSLVCPTTRLTPTPHMHQCLHATHSSSCVYTHKSLLHQWAVNFHFFPWKWEKKLRKTCSNQFHAEQLSSYFGVCVLC